MSGVASGVEHTAVGSRGRPLLQEDVEATYGGSTAGAGEERSTSMVGVWVQVEGPFRAGPSDSGSVRTHVPIQGPQQVVVSPGRRSRHDGRCRLPRGYHGRIWSHTNAHANLVSTWLESQAGPGPVALSGQVPLQELVPLTATSPRSVGLPGWILRMLLGSPR